MDARNPVSDGPNIAARSAVPVAAGAGAGPARRLAWLRGVALLCAVLLLLVISLSAFIRLSKAELSCTYWPQCYGLGLLQLQHGLSATAGEGEATAIARLAHRVVASTALLLVITLVVICMGARPVLWRQGRVAIALLALALFLAVLGLWTSNARVPAVALGNLLGGFAMLALCWRLARRGGDPGTARLRALAGFGVALLASQVALGALVSASYAAASCNSLTDCIAASRGASWSALNPWSEPVLASTPPLNASGALVQTAHRLSSVAVGLVLLGLSLAALHNRRRGPGALLLALLAVELALGLLMAGNGVSLALTLAHNAVAALLLATAFELTQGSGATPRA